MIMLDQDGKKKEGTELFSIGKDGEKIDEHIHYPILDDLDALKAMDEAHFKNLKEKGYSSKYIEKAKKTNLAYRKYIASWESKNAMARGGTPQGIMQMASNNIHPHGMIKSTIPGRTDKIPMSVPTGSYIIPADIPSALGQGNTEAGGQIMSKMFTSGPYGTSLMKGSRNRGGGSRLPPNQSMMRHPSIRRRFADGGKSDHVQIIAAGGEYVVYPDAVAEVGNGSLTDGHKVLDKFVLHTRKKHITTLKKLPGPKK